MKEQWLKLAEKFDALSLRERILVAAGMIGVTVYMSYFLLIDPLLAARPRLEQAIKQERAMLKSVDAILKTGPGAGEDAQLVKRSYQEALRKQLADLNESLVGMQTGLVPPEKMAKLLEGVIAKDRGVELLSLRKLPVQRVRAVKPVAAASGAETVPAVGTKALSEGSAGGVYQHGFEITIQGSYGGLHDYLARLEKLPWRMFWGKLSLNAENHPDIRLTLVVQTLSLDRAWLTI
ncbi:MAG: type II secretion system protein M [Betaproteobacteria bacterium]|nr:type II secretion system protein M [Betaproteobacteria bacterium]